VTPSKVRSGELSDDHKAAIARIKNFTDFNDLATKSAYGMVGVERQLFNSMNRIIEQRVIKQQQVYDEKLEQRHVQRKAMKS
jgi:putative DNA primase/helicase